MALAVSKKQESNMLDIIDFEKLKNLTKAAAKKSFEALRNAYPNETFVGYALCTDDGVMTIYPVGCTEEWLLQGKNREYIFAPVEWRYAEGEPGFDQVYDMLMERVDKQYEEQYEDLFEHIVDETFQSLVLALFELRKEGFFNENIFLSVLSTDPSDHMIELETRAIKLLNSAEMISKWEAWNNEYN